MNRRGNYLLGVLLINGWIMGTSLASKADSLKTSESENLEMQRPNVLLEGGNAAILATRRSFFIKYSDEVTGGCLPRPVRLRDKLELSMRRNGLKISTEKNTLNDTLTLSALGFRAGTNYCAVSLTLTLEVWIGAKVPYAQGNPSGDITLLPMQFIVGQYLLTGRRGSMQNRLEKVSQELGDQLYLQIARSQDEIFKKFPVIRRNFEQVLKNKK